MSSYRVTAPYITPKVRDDASGGYIHRGYYADAVLEGDNIDAASLQHHLDNDMLVEVDPPVEAKADPVEAIVVVPAEPAGAPTRPHGNAAQAAWLDYAVSKRAEGVSEEDARAALSEKTKAELVAEFGS
jgi:hypothetical protein